MLVAAAVLALAGVVWLVSAVVSSTPCQGISFHSAAPPGVSRPAQGRSPIGGIGGTRARVRAAFRGAGQTGYCHDFADPFVLRVGRRYFAFATNNGDDHIPMLATGGLFRRSGTSEALPQLPSWSAPGSVWAPAVLARGDTYVMYYSTLDSASGRNCLSRAISRSPGGPFVDTSTSPWICPPRGGAIDASPFVDADGRAYLVWKSFGGPNGIVAAPLSTDGLDLTAAPVVLLHADQPWEAGVVEGPAMVRDASGYYLFYSGNDWRTASYAIGYATCAGPLGPCTKPSATPWLTATGNAQGPGGQDLFTDDRGRLWMVFHAWIGGKVGYPNGARNLFVARVAFVDGAPVTA